MTQDPATARNRHNIVLTGPGRSGTTLTCFLLNKLPDTVALSEPIAPGQYAKRLPDYEAVVDGIEEFYKDMREMALGSGMVISKHIGGKVPDNTKGIKDGVRQRIAQKGEIVVGKELSSNFYLAIKQPNMFSALLPFLVKLFPCYAIIRNPLAVIASAGSLKRSKVRMNPPASVRYDPEEARYLEGAKDPVDRRIRRLDHFYGRYLKELPEGHVIRYEDIVASGGRVLSAIVPAARDLDEALENKNSNPIYDKTKVLEVGQRLLESDGAYWRLYSRESVRVIMDAAS